MLVLVFARFVQGIGGGGLYVVSLATVAKTYPDRIRPRVMALLASMWILPGLVGPSVGALIAETIGWRWAFVAPLPLIALAVLMVLPALRDVSASEEESRVPVVASLVLMVGAGALLAGLTDLSPWSIPLIAGGLVVTILRAPADHATGDADGSTGAARCLGSRLPRVGGVLRDGRLRDVDAHRGARAVARRGEHRADGLPRSRGRPAPGGSRG